jgi:hypothetical protein
MVTEFGVTPAALAVLPEAGVAPDDVGAVDVFLLLLLHAVTPNAIAIPSDTADRPRTTEPPVNDATPLASPVCRTIRNCRTVVNYLL